VTIFFILFCFLFACGYLLLGELTYLTLNTYTIAQVIRLSNGKYRNLFSVPLLDKSILFFQNGGINGVSHLVGFPLSYTANGGFFPCIL